MDSVGGGVLSVWGVSGVRWEGGQEAGGEDERMDRANWGEKVPEGGKLGRLQSRDNCPYEYLSLRMPFLVSPSRAAVYLGSLWSSRR